MTHTTLAGVVLAGGRATRFGSDKALAVVDGRTLLDRAVGCLREACDGPVLLASGDGTSRPGVADGQVVDLEPDAGPLSAIGSALLALGGTADAVAVLAVDHTAPSSSLFRLLAASLGASACAVAEVGGRLQPLHAVWSTAVGSDVAASVASGQRSVVRWLRDRADVTVVPERVLAAAGVDAAAAVHDADAPDDLPA